MAPSSCAIFLWLTIIGFLIRLESHGGTALNEPYQTRPLSTIKTGLIQRGIVMHLSMQRKLGRLGRSTYPNIKRGRMHALHYIAIILILNASDTEQNPGPRTPKYPCQICSKAVTWKQRGVACDDCEKWFHADCMHMSTPVYMALNNISWHCTNCGMPNIQPV